MKASSKSNLPQEGTRRKTGESLPGTGSPANAGDLVPGRPTVSGGGKKTPNDVKRKKVEGEELRVDKRSMGRVEGSCEKGVVQRMEVGEDLEREEVEVSDSDDAELDIKKWSSIETFREAEGLMSKLEGGNMDRMQYMSSVLSLPIEEVTKRFQETMTTRTGKAGDTARRADKEMLEILKTHATELLGFELNDLSQTRMLEVHERLCEGAQNHISRLPAKYERLKRDLETSIGHLRHIRSFLDVRCSHVYEVNRLHLQSINRDCVDLEKANAVLNKRVLELEGMLRTLKEEAAARERHPVEAPSPPAGAMNEGMTEAMLAMQHTLNASVEAINRRLDGLEGKLAAPKPVSFSSVVARDGAEEFPALSARPRGGRRPRTSDRAQPSTQPAPAGKRKGAKGPSRTGEGALGVPKKRVALRQPRSAAIVLQLKPEAIAKGVSYAATMTRASDAISLEEFGIPGVRTKMAQSGAMLIEVPGADSGEAADRLAQKMEEVVSDVATVVRPEMHAAIRLLDLGVSTTPEMVVAAVSAQGGCPEDRVRVGSIGPGPGGHLSVLVQCPVRAARTVAGMERLRVGWSLARAEVIGPRPMRCFKCMGMGHTRPVCPSNADKSGCCFRCGMIGHKAETCTKPPHCLVCAEAALPHGHVMGSRWCRPPTIRMRVLVGRETRPAPAAPEEMEANEESPIRVEAPVASTPTSPLSLPDPGADTGASSSGKGAGKVLRVMVSDVVRERASLGEDGGKPVHDDVVRDVPLTLPRRSRRVARARSPSKDKERDRS